MQRTLIIFKPDCVQRRLVGQILSRFEAKGLRVAALKLIQVDRALGEKHYAEHQGKPFFEGLISFITGGPVVVGVLEGNEAIAVVRTMLGATNGVAAAPGTVRGDFSISKQNNLVHGSDSEESAKREIALWFKPEEVVSYTIAGSEWVERQEHLAGIAAFVSHGRQDPDLSFAAGQRLAAFLTSSGASVDWLPFDGGHGIPFQVWKGFRRFLEARVHAIAQANIYGGYTGRDARL